MSSSRHPVALRLERFVGGEARLLATVMALPLVDGIFAALVLGGALESPTGVLEVGLLIFGGSATLAVILAEMRVPPRQGARAVLVVGAVLTVGAALEAALAPTIESVVDVATFERFAALVIAAIAAKTASARIGEHLPGPGVVVGLGFLASVDPAGARFVVDPDPALVGKAAAAALVGTAFALLVALLAPRLRGVIDVDRFRFGSAVALGLLALSILGMDLGQAPLVVVAVAGLLAYAPDGAGEGADDSGAPGDPGDGSGDPAAGDADGESDDGSLAGLADAATARPVTDGGDAGTAGIPTPIPAGSPGDDDGIEGPAAAAPDGADETPTGAREVTTADPDDPADAGDSTETGAPTTDGERPPWL